LREGERQAVDLDEPLHVDRDPFLGIVGCRRPIRRRIAIVDQAGAMVRGAAAREGRIAEPEHRIASNLTLRRGEVLPGLNAGPCSVRTCATASFRPGEVARNELMQ
jgi:hypothetical protein